MSQFDFPRIHFSGHFSIDPATGNNCFFQPISYYDPIEAKALVPPRLYLREQNLKKGMTMEMVKQKLPNNSKLKTDEQGWEYVEMIELVELEEFREWAITPLGSHIVDRAYHEVYHCLKAERTNQPIVGQFPGYWNYYGDLSFNWEDVKINAVQCLDAQGQILHFTDEAPTNPEWVNGLLQAELRMKDRRGKPSAVMIDVLPTMAMYSQVFCDSLTMVKNDQQLMSGKPEKASLRFLNLRRIINQPEIVGASGAFYTVIPKDKLDKGSLDLVMQVFEKNNARADKIEGIYIRYEMLEVVENRGDPKYHYGKITRNPARGTIVGTLSPWYSGEMKTIHGGRQLNPINDLLPHRPLGAMACNVNEELGIISIDGLTSFPQENLDLDDEGNEPVHFPQKYRLYDLGEIDLLVETGEQEILIGTQTIGGDGMNREELFKIGGILDFNIKDKTVLQAINNGVIKLQIRNDKSEEPKLVLKESNYMVTTDNPGLYIEEDEDPKDGYRSNRYQKEPFVLSIFSKGKPAEERIELFVIEYKITNAGMVVNEVDISINGDGKYGHNDIIIFPNNQASNSIYYFSENFSFRAIGDLQNEITKSGYFVNLRVLPTHNFGPYTDPSHPDFPKIPEYDFVYEHFFKFYEFIYPISSEISSFEEEKIIKGAPFLLRLMSPDNWDSNTYMPSTREMSSGQHALVTNWLKSHMKNMTPMKRPF